MPSTPASLDTSLIAYHDTTLANSPQQLTHAHLNPTTGVQLLLAMSFSLLLDPEGMATFDIELTRALQAMRTPNEKYVYLGEGEEGQAVSLVIPFLSIALPTPSLDASNTLTEAHRCLLSAEECREHRVATTQLLSYQLAANHVKAYAARNSKDEATRKKILLYLQERLATTTHAIQTINNAMVARHEARHEALLAKEAEGGSSAAVLMAPEAGGASAGALTGSASASAGATAGSGAVSSQASYRGAFTPLAAAQRLAVPSSAASTASASSSSASTISAATVVEEDEPGGNERLACPSCTFLNFDQLSHCEMCACKL
jgi:hypothetical protein